MAEDLKSKLAAINAAKADRAKKEAETKVLAEQAVKTASKEKENLLLDKAKELETKVAETETAAKEAEESIQQAYDMLAEGGLEADEMAEIQGIKAEAAQKIVELADVKAELVAVRKEIEQLKPEAETKVELTADQMKIRENLINALNNRVLYRRDFKLENFDLPESEIHNIGLEFLKSCVGNEKAADLFMIKKVFGLTETEMSDTIKEGIISILNSENVVDIFSNIIEPGVSTEFGLISRAIDEFNLTEALSSSPEVNKAVKQGIVDLFSRVTVSDHEPFVRAVDLCDTFKVSKELLSSPEIKIAVQKLSEVINELRPDAVKLDLEFTGLTSKGITEKINAKKATPDGAKSFERVSRAGLTVKLFDRRFPTE